MASVRLWLDVERHLDTLHESGAREVFQRHLEDAKYNHRTLRLGTCVFQLEMNTGEFYCDLPDPIALAHIPAELEEVVRRITVRDRFPLLKTYIPRGIYRLGAALAEVEYNSGAHLLETRLEIVAGDDTSGQEFTASQLLNDARNLYFDLKTGDGKAKLIHRYDPEEPLSRSEQEETEDTKLDQLIREEREGWERAEDALDNQH